jgi:hypothetical protein
MRYEIGRTWARLRDEWRTRLEPGEQVTVLVWSTFTVTFAGLRALTHWIRAGLGPSGGGMSLGGKHFHHYNLGIALPASVATVGLRETERQRHHPAAAIAFGAANAMIVDELALLLDLEDVYWATEGAKASTPRSGSSLRAARSLPACRSGRTHAARCGTSRHERLSRR